MTHQIRLWYQGHTDNGGRSDKVYIVAINRNGNGYSVKAQWGRRGGTLREQVKGNHSSHWAALAAFNSIVGEKMDKGYAVTERCGSFCGPVAIA